MHVSHANSATQLPQLPAEAIIAGPDEAAASIDETEEIREMLSHYLAAAEAQSHKPT
jgi:hypothetical protein